MQKDDNKRKIEILIDKPISEYKDDYIGVGYQVQSIVDAVNKGASIISINSQYGTGKSSICNLLARENCFDKVSNISLWENIDETKGSEHNQNIDIFSFYKSFLFKLASDFHGVQFAKYVDKSLNKSSGSISLFLKNKNLLVSIILLLFFVLGFYLFSCVTYTYELTISNEINISIDIPKLLSYASLFGGIITPLFTLRKEKIVYTSWKSETNRVIEIDDITSLYTEIIDESIKKGGKKNLIIIEDIDRCSKNVNVLVQQFIISIVRLIHHSCVDKSLDEKLKSIVLVLCLNENDIFGAADNKLEKLFDYRLDLGVVHNDSFRGILLQYISKLNLTKSQNDALLKLLRSRKNNFRLIKQEINDCIVKYNTLEERFSNKAKDQGESSISFESCVAYSYLKNNYPENFQFIFIKNQEKTTNCFTEAINEKNRRHSLDEIKRPLVELVAKNDENDNFIADIAYFICESYIDESFKLYFFNYPKYEYCNNIYESNFLKFLKTGENLNLENNASLSDDFIKSTAKYMEEIKMPYPVEILKDKKTIEIILSEFSNFKTIQMLFAEAINLLNDELLQLSIQWLEYISKLGVALTLPYLKEQINVKKCDCLVLSKLENFYVFRKKMFSYLKDSIVGFDFLFSNQFNSLSKEEFSYLSNKSIAIKLMNKTYFDEDTEDILLDIMDLNIDIKDLIFYCKLWQRNVFKKFSTPNKYLKYAIAILSKYGQLEEDILSFIVKLDLEYLKGNSTFIDYLNKIAASNNDYELKILNGCMIYFGYKQDLIINFTNRGYFDTPVLFWLYNNKFEEISNCSVNLLPYIVKLINNSNYGFLTGNIIEFKKYILNCTQNIKFNDLFLNESYAKKYDVGIINWSNVENVSLLVKCNVKNTDNILIFIKNNKIMHTDDIVCLLDLIFSEISSEKLSNNQLLSYVLDVYQTSFNNEAIRVAFKKCIDKITDIDYKMKLAIDYQITTHDLLTKYYSNLINFPDDADYKNKFNNFVNSLDKKYYGIDLLKTLTYYPFNDDLIESFKKFGMNDQVIASLILRNQFDRLLSECSSILNSHVIDKLLKNEHMFTILISNKSLINIVKNYNKLENIPNEQFVDLLQNFKSDSNLFELYFNNLSGEKMENILSACEKLEKDNCWKLIDFIKNNEEFKIFIKYNQQLKNHIYSLMSRELKSLFTRYMNKE